MQTSSLQYSALDSDKVLSFVLRNDEKLKEDSLIYFQNCHTFYDYRIVLLDFHDLSDSHMVF